MRSLRAYCCALRAKVVSKAGETLVEALVAVLISAMSMLMLYTAVATCGSILAKNSETAGTYYTSLEVLASGSGTADATGSNQSVVISGSANASGVNETVKVDYVAKALPGADANVPTCVSYQATT